MKWMIKNATIMTFDNSDTCLEKYDIVIDKNRIGAIGQKLPIEHFEPEMVLWAEDKLLMPGLINSHLHSHDRFDKGRFDNFPLEVWMALYNPPLGRRNWTSRECYLRTLLNCIEMMKTGTTTVIDDVVHGIPFSRENIDAVFQAYEDVGMRANVSIHYSDKPYAETIPYLDQYLPEVLKMELNQTEAPSISEVLDVWRRYALIWDKRVKFILSPSAPQRCSNEFLKRTWNLSEELGLPVLIHVLETKSQAVTGNFVYKKSIIEFMESLGILTPMTVLIHAVWMTDQDIDIIGNCGCSIVHNPVSNLKLGSGIASIRKILEKSINVGLGTDNNNANDAANIFEAMKITALLQKVKDFDYEKWIGANEVLKMVTYGGARCCNLNTEIGSISEGMKADFILLDLKKLSFYPQNNLKHQLVYCEHGESVDTVVIDGKIVVKNRKILTINEEKIVDEARERETEIINKIREASIRGSEIEPYVRKAYFKCIQQDTHIRGVHLGDD